MVYYEIAGATNFKRKNFKQDSEALGTYVITISNQAKEKFVDGDEFEEVVELNDLLLKKAIEQKDNLRGWRIALNLNNGTTISVGKIIGVVLQNIGGIERTIATCLMSNGAYLILTTDNDNHILTATLSSSGLINGGGVKQVAFANVSFNASGVATLSVNADDFATLVGSDSCVVVLNLANGDTLELNRGFYDENGASFVGSVGHENGEYTLDLYFANFVKAGDTYSGNAYEVNAFEGNVAIPSGVEPHNLQTAKILGDYYEWQNYVGFSKDVAYTSASVSFTLTSDEWVSAMNNDNCLLLIRNTTDNTYYTMWKSHFDATTAYFTCVAGGKGYEAEFVKNGTSYSGTFGEIQLGLTTSDVQDLIDGTINGLLNEDF